MLINALCFEARKFDKGDDSKNLWVAILFNRQLYPPDGQTSLTTAVVNELVFTHFIKHWGF